MYFDQKWQQRIFAGGDGIHWIFLQIEMHRFARSHETAQELPMLFVEFTKFVRIAKV